MITKYTATRAHEEAIIALLPSALRDEVTDALRADAWLGVFIRPQRPPKPTWHEELDR